MTAGTFGAPDHVAYHEAWWALALRGVIAILIGILIFARPFMSVAVLALVIAIWAIFAGITEIIRAFHIRHAVPQWWVWLLGGIINLGFGIAAIFYYPALSLAFAVIWVAWWLAASGVVGIIAAMQERRMGLSWGWTMVWGILSVLAGLFALFHPPATVAAIIALIGAFAIVGGIFLLIAAFRSHGERARYRNAGPMPGSAPA